MGNCFKKKAKDGKSIEKEEKRQKTMFPYVGERIGIDETDEPPVRSEKWTNPSLRPSTISENLFGDVIKLPWEGCFTEEQVFEKRGWKLILSEKILGKGSFGVVRKCIRKDGKIFACKTVRSKRGSLKDTKNELYFMMTCEHPNIIRSYDYFILDDNVHIIMEYARNGSLKNICKKLGPLDEGIAKEWFKQIASAIEYLHKKGAAHRDLKLANILVFRKNTGERIMKVTDFGLSRICFRWDKGVVMQKHAVGTELYMSPQILKIKLKIPLDKSETYKGGYDPFKADMWALGIILYMMLTKSAPFQCQDKEKVWKLMSKRRYKIFPYKDKPPISDSAQHLIKSLLEPNVSLRIDIDSVMQHKWLPEDKKIKKLSAVKTAESPKPSNQTTSMSPYNNLPSHSQPSRDQTKN